MSRYKCDKCNYQTNNKNHFTDHINRKIPCNINKLNKKIKSTIKLHCEICKKNFSREDSLTRHNKTFHSKITGDYNNQNNGNNNTITNITTQNNIGIQINIINPVIIQPIIYNYIHNDIKDLTLFEQYLSLTSKIYNAISNVIDSKRIMIIMIYDRFRCFLNKKAICMIPEGIYHGLSDNYYFHKKLVKHIKVHLYNNRKLKPKNKEEIPNNKDHEVFWALSKKFTWDEVDKLISKMDELDINFDANLDDIKQELLMHIDINPKFESIFKKLLKRIDRLILNFNENMNE
ncbi:hypothetical protein [Powai lake megavirus]|uniref:C2H2-type domain-containing protein n=1 Tax=Powai lake megavirus TaxID=1842663 RepID=A0A167R0M2_9VIRU|nr:hypothetical protein QJ849_gp008 [Powai lake megavirus]ANB50170.1 hypothetical protein [Powai lake megavirus]